MLSVGRRMGNSVQEDASWRDNLYGVSVGYQIPNEIVFGREGGDRHGYVRLLVICSLTHMPNAM